MLLVLRKKNNGATKIDGMTTKSCFHHVSDSCIVQGTSRQHASRMGADPGGARREDAWPVCTLTLRSVSPPGAGWGEIESQARGRITAFSAPKNRIVLLDIRNILIE